MEERLTNLSVTIFNLSNMNIFVNTKTQITKSMIKLTQDLVDLNHKVFWAKNDKEKFDFELTQVDFSVDNLISMGNIDSGQAGSSSTSVSLESDFANGLTNNVSIPPIVQNNLESKSQVLSVDDLILLTFQPKDFGFEQFDPKKL